MKSKYIIFQILILFSVTVAGQTKYSGSFNTENFSGTSTYYYSNSGSGRIYDGSFNFSKNSQINISGKFEDNLKTGKWNFKIKNYKYSDLMMDYKITANVSGYFANGNLDGNWTLSRTKTISFSKNGISQYYQSNLNLLSYMLDGETVDFDKSYNVVESSNVSFKDNHFAKKFTYKKGKTNISGQFDNEGYYNGNWIVKYYANNILITQTRTYLHGILASVKELDNSTGNLTILMDTTKFVQKIIDNYDKLNDFSKVNGKIYTFKNSASYENKSEYLDNAIKIWYNNKSIVNSAYNFEIQHGSNEMTTYPERAFSYDYQKTYAEEQRVIKAKQDSIRKEKERIELLALIEKRRTTNYDLKQKKRSDYNNLETKISELIATEIQNFSSNELTLNGKISFFSDTSGIKSFDFSNLQSNNQAFLKSIKSKLQVFEINSILEKNYKFNTFANYSINSSYHSYGGKVSFKIKEKQGQKSIIYVNESPENNIQDAIKNYYQNKTEGKYKISYEIISLNGKATADFETIQFKENKHIGKKILKVAGYTVAIIGAVIYYVLTEL